MTYRWTGAHAFRDHANDRVIEAGEELPEDVAEQVAAAHPHDVERIDEDDGAAPPFDPTELTVDEIEDEIDDGDYSDAELEAVAAVEKSDDSRETALDAIDEARE